MQCKMQQRLRRARAFEEAPKHSRRTSKKQTRMRGMQSGKGGTQRQRHAARTEQGIHKVANAPKAHGFTTAQLAAPINLKRPSAA